MLSVIAITLPISIVFGTMVMSSLSAGLSVTDTDAGFDVTGVAAESVMVAATVSKVCVRTFGVIVHVFADEVQSDAADITLLGSVHE